ncbi:MAG: hypothetical protein NUV78_00205 [Candidatus Zambryskibacteria bacterium]|nr:hypothetical protein [Candidatus Zambryskibacteria bacterium]
MSSNSGISCPQRSEYYRYKARMCGHRTRLSDFVDVFGEHTKVQISLGDAKQPQYCIRCLGKMSIQCGWCEKTIHIGDPVTLYTPAEDFSGVRLSKHAHIYETLPLQIVNCMRRGCAMSDGDRLGFWQAGDSGEGYLMRVPSILEVMTNFGKPAIVLIHNMRSIEEALNPAIVPIAQELTLN